MAAAKTMNATTALAPPTLNQRRRAVVRSAVILGFALLAGGALFAVDPARHAIYPACWLYATTGLQCPGCGGLRATHQLLHGRLAAAWGLNPLAVLLTPLYAWFGLDALLTLLRGRGLPGSTPRPAVIWLGVAGIILFGLLRILLSSKMPWW